MYFLLGMDGLLLAALKIRYWWVGGSDTRHLKLRICRLIKNRLNCRLQSENIVSNQSFIKAG